MKRNFWTFLMLCWAACISAADYLTVAQVMQIYEQLALTSGSASADTYTVRGYVTQWNSGYPSYQNADFFIDDTPDGSTSLLKCFRLPADNDNDKRTLEVGEYVEVTAQLKNWYDQPELAGGTFHTTTYEQPEQPEDPENPVNPPVVTECPFPDLDGKTSKDILNALHEKIVEHTVLSYDDIRADRANVDWREDGTLWDMYSDCEFTRYSNKCYGEITEECNCFNREHVVPQSWWGNDDTQPMRYDLYNVIPTDGYANSQRGADAYGEVSEIDWSNSLGSKHGNSNTYTGGSYRKVFEPVDKYKGDIARVYFYMITCYLDKNFTKKGQGYRMFGYASNTANFTSAALKLLLKWHRADPVSEKEIKRNDGIEAKQGNRNPFVDDPDLVEYIWGNKKTEAYSCNSSPDPEQPETPEDPEQPQDPQKVYYSVAFYDWDDTLLKKESVEKGHDATPPDDPHRQGYRFIGWDEDYTNVQQNLVIYAQYKKREEAVDNINTPEIPVKIIQNGQILILRGDRIYTVTGQEIIVP